MKSFIAVCALLASFGVSCNNKAEDSPKTSHMIGKEMMAQHDCPTTTDASGMDPGRARYRAEQSKGVVRIYAEGENPSPGYANALSQSMLRIWPPQYGFFWKPPEGIAATVMTPFKVCAQFNADDKIDRVVVTDADGRHEVPVEQVNE